MPPPTPPPYIQRSEVGFEVADLPARVPSLIWTPRPWPAKQLNKEGLLWTRPLCEVKENCWLYPDLDLWISGCPPSSSSDEGQLDMNENEGCCSDEERGSCRALLDRLLAKQDGNPLLGASFSCSQRAGGMYRSHSAAMLNQWWNKRVWSLMP